MATACKAPTGFIVGLASSQEFTPEHIESDNGIDESMTVAWSGALAGTSNAITGYDIDGNDSSDGVTWGSWVGLAIVTTSERDGTTVVPIPAAYGEYFKLRIRTMGTAGEAYYSTFKESGVFVRNTRPETPTIDHPATDNMPIYNPRPRVLLTIEADADGENQQIRDDTVTWAQPTYYRAEGTKYVLRKVSDAAEGDVEFTTRVRDAIGGYDRTEATAIRTVAYSVPDYTDTLTAGSTRIKAAHMNELRDMIDDVRAYYGLAGYSWAESITAETSMSGWRDHIAEMRTAIEQIAATVNAWNTYTTTNNITLPAWIAIVGAQPSAAVMQQIRDVIPTL